MKKVSIILTTYKGEDCIHRCLQAACSQDYPEYEVIVVDDNGRGSESQVLTERLVNPFVEKYNVKYIVHESNKNGSVARNTGIRNSSGEYITFLDDDDVLYPNSLIDRVAALENHTEEYGIVLGSFKIIREGFNSQDNIYAFDGDILKDFLLNKIQSPSTVIMVRKTVIDKVGLWDESFLRHQDWEFVTRVVYEYKACCTKEIIAEKYVIQRNFPSDPEVFKERRLHYLRKMQPYMNRFDMKTKNDILYVHFFEISKSYLKLHDIKNTMKWAIKTKKPIKACINLVVDAVAYRKRKT